MLDLILGWAVIFFPFALAVAFVFVPTRSENESAHMKWRFCLVAFGILFSLLAWLQQSRALKASAHDRESAISETSTRVASETADRVTRAMTAQYEGTISGLNRQIGGLQGQLSAIGQATSENAKVVTGGDSYCYVTFANRAPDNSSMMLMAVHRGRYPLRDVRVRMVDQIKSHKLYEAHGPSESALSAAETNIAIGDLATGHAESLGWKDLKGAEKFNFLLQFSALNGSWYEVIRLRLVNGEWRQAMKVFRDVVVQKDKPAQEKVLFEPSPSSEYPLVDGKVDWAD
jgi:hypothetical protein